MIRFVFGYGYSRRSIVDDDLSFVIYSVASPYLFGLIAHGTQTKPPSTTSP